VSKSQPKVDADADGQRVLCRRMSKPIAPEDHVACPYCFGALGEVGTGEHEKFCDFDPDKDPHCYGFPPGSDRSEIG